MKRIQLIGIALILVISISLVAYGSKNEEGPEQVGKFCVDLTDRLYQFGIVIPQQECVVCRNSGLDSYPVCACIMWERGDPDDFGQNFKNFGQCVKFISQIMH